MKSGVCIPNLGPLSSLEKIVSLTEVSEELGFDSIGLTDHVLFPSGTGMPYERTFESMTTLSFLAARTRKIKLGFSALILPMRNPVVVAKQLSTLDILSNGRLMVAVGVGSYEPEFRNVGADYHNRGRRQDESIAIIRSLWEGRAASYYGRYSKIDFDNAILSPKPVQKHLTIWIAGSSRAAMERAIRLGDGWYPNALPLEELKPLIGEFSKNAAKERKITLAMNIALDPRASETEYVSPSGQRRCRLTGNKSQNSEMISDLQSLGLEYLMLVPDPAGSLELDTQKKILSDFAQNFLV